MVGFYTPIILLQAFCVYHAFKNNAEHKWYWLILIFPGVGCLFYLYHNFYNRTNVQSISEGLKEVVNSNYKIQQLEKALRFSDTISNRIHLADAYVEYGRYSDAIGLYKSCMQGFMADDIGIRKKLLQAHFYNKEYAAAVDYGNALESEKAFKNAEERIAYAWALHYDGKTDAAEKVFKDMDKPFTNYSQRAAYCKFLRVTKNEETLKNMVGELLEEFEHMKGTEKRVHAPVIREVRQLYGG